MALFYPRPNGDYGDLAGNLQAGPSPRGSGAEGPGGMHGGPRLGELVLERRTLPVITIFHGQKEVDVVSLFLVWWRFDWRLRPVSLSGGDFLMSTFGIVQACVPKETRKAIQLFKRGAGVSDEAGCSYRLSWATAASL